MREHFAGFLQLAFHARNALGVPLPGRYLALRIFKKGREAANGGLEVFTRLGVATVVLAYLALKMLGGVDAQPLDLVSAPLLGVGGNDAESGLARR